ncbi:MAG: hypothetical protein GY936_01490, partial [Ignavibacteriae bacterium]|nr:hypothetical protein [Ignavibacteriota bacterium]
MNKSFFLILFLISASILFSQKVIFEEKYSNFPFELQIDNSGIYSIASFDVDDESIFFSSFTKDGIYEIRNRKFAVESIAQKMGNDFIAKATSDNSFLQKENRTLVIGGRVLYKKNFLNKNSILKDNSGQISGFNGEEILISAPNRNVLIIKNNLTESKNEMVFNFPKNLACANLIGIDKSGNLFVVVEKYMSEIPLQVERQVYTISKNGNILSRL